MFYLLNNQIKAKQYIINPKSLIDDVKHRFLVIMSYFKQPPTLFLPACNYLLR